MPPDRRGSQQAARGGGTQGGGHADDADTFVAKGRPIAPPGRSEAMDLMVTALRESGRRLFPARLCARTRLLADDAQRVSIIRGTAVTVLRGQNPE